MILGMFSRVSTNVCLGLPSCVITSTETISVVESSRLSRTSVKVEAPKHTPSDSIKVTPFFITEMNKPAAYRVQAIYNFPV